MSDTVIAAEAENGAVDDLESMIITELDTSHIEIDDGKAVDSFISEKEQRLLAESLRTSWKGPGNDRPFLVCANVGLFHTLYGQPYVPDVMVSLDVRHRGTFQTKGDRTYFVWEYGKTPDIVVEIVSNRKGGELTDKLQGYARLKIEYYIVHDPERFLGDQELYVFKYNEGEYEPITDSWFTRFNLGVCLWQGHYEDAEMTWLRWCDAQGNVLPTGAEAAATAQRHAEQGRGRAERLAVRLRALGVDPDEST